MISLDSSNETDSTDFGNYSSIEIGENQFKSSKTISEKVTLKCECSWYRLYSTGLKATQLNLTGLVNDRQS